ncbi:response regulator [Ruegeria sp.]|uniref:response regulator n=1 Tax=Ruegeria sp. TaxID=1879320 RepID=UPI003B5AB14D
MRILAVDDDPSILELLHNVLAAFGYKDVVTARNGREALEILSNPSEAFDCLLLDVQMPQMNGIALCEEARKLPGYLYTPIIMVTAMVQKQYIDEAFEAGATDYVTKPFEFSDLKQRLSDAYRMAAERRAAIEVFEADAHAWPESELYPDDSVSEPQYFGDLPGCIGLAEFENYVIQLATMHSAAAKIVAVRVSDAEHMYRSSSKSEFREAMAAAGTALLRATQEGRKVATYWGNGVFLIVFDKQAGMKSEPSLLQVPTITGAATDHALAFQIGEEITLEASTKMEALFLIDKAVELVEMQVGQAVKTG